MYRARREGNVGVMRFHFCAAALVTSVAVCLACADSEDLAAETSTLSGYCDARAKTECNAAIVTACGVTSTASCVTARTADCTKNVPQGTTYVPTAGPACLQAVQAAYTTATITADSLAAVEAACEPVFSGPGAARAPCTVDYDCSLADGLRCITPTGETSSKCLVPNMIAAGGTCPGEADVCSGPYFCNPQSLVCVAEGALGSQCIPDQQPCQQGFRCPGSPFDSTCTALPISGMPCTTATDCASNLCDKASGQAEGVCADQIQLTPLDSMCASYEASPSGT